MPAAKATKSTTVVAKATKFSKVLVSGKRAKSTIGDAERAAIAKLSACTALSLTRVVLPDLTCALLLPKLASLELYGTSIADWSALAGIKTLRSVFINGIRDPDKLSVLSTLVQLTEITVINQPTLTTMPSLAKLTKLRSVSVMFCKRMGDLTAFERRLPERCVLETA